ncbi:MAG: universal stress protein [Rhodoferax sp.]|uniref:universal stress protein n=1 Tax=Rhodoferax sp. TaxID=50421 RepID=UPI003C794F68
MNNEQIILACVDSTAASDAVADYAAWAAHRLQAPMELLHVLDRHVELTAGQDHSGAIGLGAQEKLLAKLSEEDEERTRAARETGRVFLNRLRERAVASGATSVDTRLRHGEVEETLAEQQDRSRLLVIGRAGSTASNQGTGLGKHLEWVVRSVNRPVLVTTDTYSEPGKVLFAFDGSSVTRKGVEMLTGSPLLKGLSLHLLMSGTSNAQSQSQMEWAVQLLKKAGMDVTSEIVAGGPQDAVAHALRTQGFNFLVMGAYSHSPLRGLFMGSKTSEMLKDAKVATLLLR